MALSLAFLSATMLGSAGGFSSGGYPGIVTYDTSKYLFGILDIHNGSLGSSHCAGATALNSAFKGGADKVNSLGDEVHAFWFLTSRHHGVETCGWKDHPNHRPLQLQAAYYWGTAQAMYLYEALDASDYTGPIDKIFADVESETHDCATDGPGWACDDFALNRRVIKGFSDYIDSHHNPGHNGIYTSPSGWDEITEYGNSTELGGHDFWLASYDPAQGDLNFAVATIQIYGFEVASWQYVADDDCDPNYPWTYTSYAEAASMAATAYARGFEIERFDVWDNNNDITVC